MMKITHSTSSTHMPTPERTIYRGYVIRYNALANLVWVEKDGFRISYCESVERGRQVIDSLYGITAMIDGEN